MTTERKADPREEKADPREEVLHQLHAALEYWTERELQCTDRGQYENAAKAHGAVLVVIRALNAEETNPDAKPFQKPHYQTVAGCRWCS